MINEKWNWIAVLLCFLPSTWLAAQDLHFSQSAIIPAYVNPSFVGKFEGNVRISGVGRTQWSSVTVPYNSFAFFGEASGVDEKNRLSLGATLIRDIAGDSKFTTQGGSVVAAYTVPLARDRTSALAFGLQFGIKSQSLSFTDLRFDNQYNGQNYDPSLPHNEIPNYSPFTTPDAAFGFSYLKRGKDSQLAFGYGAQNLIKNNQSLLSGIDVLQKTRNSFQVIADFSMNWLIVSPAIYYSKQGELSELLIGSVVSATFGDENGYIGASIFNRNKDAVILGFLTGFGGLNFGVSYDFNTSDLSEASKGKGATEITLSYVFSNSYNTNNRKGVCPAFL